jgi:hypothetical protein
MVGTIGLGRAFPLDQELPKLDALLRSQWSELPNAFETPHLAARLTRMIATILDRPYPESLSLLLHPAFVDWHFGYCQAAKAALQASQPALLPEEALVTSLEDLESMLREGNEACCSRRVPGTPFRVTSTAAWAVRSLQEQMKIDVHIIAFTNEADSRPTSAEEDGFVQDLERACGLIKEAWPEQWEDIARVVRYVIPFRGRARDSFTPERALGSIYASYRPDDAVWLADMLVHEARHNRLNLLQRRVRLYDNDDALRYWSPWRQTDRHLKGILHGVYSFTGVGHLHGRLLQQGHEVTPLTIRRLMEESDRIFSMIKLLRAHGRWTPDGLRVLDELCDEALVLLEFRDLLIRRLCPGYVATLSREAIKESLGAHS